MYMDTKGAHQPKRKTPHVSLATQTASQEAMLTCLANEYIQCWVLQPHDAIMVPLGYGQLLRKSLSYKSDFVSWISLYCVVYIYTYYSTCTFQLRSLQCISKSYETAAAASDWPSGSSLVCWGAGVRRVCGCTVMCVMCACTFKHVLRAGDHLE